MVRQPSSRGDGMESSRSKQAHAPVPALTPVRPLAHHKQFCAWKAPRYSLGRRQAQPPGRGGTGHFLRPCLPSTSSSTAFHFLHLSSSLALPSCCVRLFGVAVPYTRSTRLFPLPTHGRVPRTWVSRGSRRRPQRPLPRPPSRDVSGSSLHDPLAALHGCGRVGRRSGRTDTWPLSASPAHTSSYSYSSKFVVLVVNVNVSVSV